MTDQVPDILLDLTQRSLLHFNRHTSPATDSRLIQLDPTTHSFPGNEPEIITISQTLDIQDDTKHFPDDTKSSHFSSQSTPNSHPSPSLPISPCNIKPVLKLDMNQLKSTKSTSISTNTQNKNLIGTNNSYGGNFRHSLTNIPQLPVITTNVDTLADPYTINKSNVNLILNTPPRGSSVIKRPQPLGLKRNKYKSDPDSKEFRLSKHTQSKSIPQSSLDQSLFSLKYEEIISKFTGKLKIIGENSAESSFCEHDIELHGEIGGGVSGTVYYVEHKTSKQKMAAKRMKWNPHLEEQKRILMDLEIMAIQKSPFIVVYYGSLVVHDNVWLYMELMDTCLDKILKKHGPLPEQIVGMVVLATLNALHYLKSVHDIIHRDVKPSNILVNKLGAIKMCDFGISKQLIESCAETRGAGPTAYISPERLDIEMKEYDVRADVWSLGITVIELLTGKLPYSHCMSEIEVMSQIFQDPPPRLPDFLPVSQECRNFIERCLTKDYTKRPKYTELIDGSEFVRIYQTKEVQVADWFASLDMEK